MGQMDIEEFLKKTENKNRVFTARELAGRLDLSIAAATNNLTKLRRHKTIKHVLVQKQRRKSEKYVGGYGYAYYIE